MLGYCYLRELYETNENKAYLKSQIDSIDVDVHCDRIHLGSSTPIPLRKFDAFYLLRTNNHGEANALKY